MSDAPKGIEPRFDELIHAPTRLSIVALLAAADWADFTFVRDSLSLSDWPCPSRSPSWNKPAT